MRRRPFDLEQARVDTALGGPSWAAWRQRVHRSRVIDALGIPDPALPPEPEVAYPLQPAPVPVPVLPARMHISNLHTRRPAPPEVYVPVPNTPLPRSPHRFQFTRPERRNVLDTIRRRGPLSRTTLMSWCTGMRLVTLDAVLADLVAQNEVTLMDGKYEGVRVRASA